MDSAGNLDGSNIQAEGNSIAFGGLSVGGSVGGDIRIGHTIGYTSEQVSTLVTQISRTFQPKPFDGRSPYKGLDVFEEEDAELFFGREKLVEDLVVRVKESRTVFVTGPSGSGKSSLVRAGLIHALKQGKIPNSDRWLYATLKPGRDPFEAVAGAFSRLKSPELGDYFLKNASLPEVLHKCAESTLSERSDQRLVLFIDQFEEIFTQIHKDKAQAFVELLAHAVAVENGRVITLFSMRSDFIPNCVTYPKLNAILNRQFVQIGAMQGDELVSAIAQPALRVGLRIDPDLIAQIINDMQGEPGSLPLMQFALKDLFDAQQAKGGLIALTLNDYLQRGGIRKALERHADNSFSRLNGHERKLTRAIFSSLIEIGRGTVDTRRTAIFDELVPASARSAEVEAIVRKLADARLLTTDEVSGQDTVTISHEKLIDAWPWLRRLVDENRDVIAAQNEIAKDAKEWDDHGRDPSYLYSGARLGVAQEQLAANKVVLSGLSKEFLEEGIALREAERKAKEALRRRIITGLTAGIAVALVLAGFAFFQMFRAQRQERIALARQLVAQAQSLYVADNSKQMVSGLLYIQSMRLLTTGDAANFLLSDNLSARPVARMPHQASVTSVAFSPDGKYVVSGSADSTARVWDATTGEELARMTHEGVVTSVAFSPDNKYVVSGSQDGTARVWDAATGKEVTRITYEVWVHSVAFSPEGIYVGSVGCDQFDEVNLFCTKTSSRVWDAVTGDELLRITNDSQRSTVAFSPDGKYVVSGNEDGTVRVWEAVTWTEIASMIHEQGVVMISVSPDGKYVASGGWDGTSRVWDISTGVEVARMLHVGNNFGGLAFSPNGKYVVSTVSSTAIIWGAAAGEEIALKSNVDSAAFSPDGNYVVSIVDNTARVWEAATEEEVARMTHERRVTSVDFSPDGKYVVTGSEDGTARVWEAAVGNEIAHIKTSGGWAAFSPDGKYVIVSAECDLVDSNRKCIRSSTQVWATSTWSETTRLTNVYAVAYSPDGKFVASSRCDQYDDNFQCTRSTTTIWTTTTWNEVARLAYDGSVGSVAFSPDGKFIAFYGCDQYNDYFPCTRSTTTIWTTTTWNEVARLTYDGSVGSVAFSPNGKFVVYDGCDQINEVSLWCSKSTVRVLETSTWNEIARMTHEYWVSSVAFSSDERYVVSAGCDQYNENHKCLRGTAHVLEIATRKEVSLLAHDDYVNSVAFSPDGKYVLSGSEDGTARVWATGTWNEIPRRRMIHEGAVNSVAFSPDGKYVLTWSYNTAHVWEAITGNELARKSNVESAAFSPDGKYVLSGSRGIFSVWYWQTKDLITRACDYMPRNLTRVEWRQYIGDALPYPAKQEDATCPNLPIEPEVTVTPTVTP